MAAQKKAKATKSTKKTVRIQVISSEAPNDSEVKSKTKAKKEAKPKKTTKKKSKSAAKTKSVPQKKKTAAKKPKTVASKPKKKAAKKPVPKKPDAEPEEISSSPPETPVVVEPAEDNTEAVDYSAEFTEDNLIFKDITEKNGRLLWKLLRTSLLLIIFALAISLVIQERAGLPDVNYLNQSEKAADTVESVEGRYLFTGTIVWDRNIEEWSKNDAGVIDFAQPFSGLGSYSPAKYDAWVADLECPISSEDIPYEVGLTTLEFNCRPEYLPFAAEYFEFMNLANNHSDNSGREKLDETRTRLNAASTQYFGDPDPSQVDDICEVVGLPVRQKMSTGLEVEARMPVAFCAWHYFLRLPLPGEIEELQKYADVMPVFAFLHMGPEYKAEANKFQVQMARDVIDSGADFVIANNPHWVQNAEVYKDKLVVYSTGNFIFDQTWSEEVGSSASIDAIVDFSVDESTADWLALGDSCLVYADDCLAQAVEQGLTKPETSYRYDLIAGDIRDKLQTKAGDEVQSFVEDRLDWPKILQELGQEQ